MRVLRWGCWTEGADCAADNLAMSAQGFRRGANRVRKVRSVHLVLSTHTDLLFLVEHVVEGHEGPPSLSPRFPTTLTPFRRCASSSESASPSSSSSSSSPSSSPSTNKRPTPSGTTGQGREYHSRPRIYVPRFRLMCLVV